MLKRFAAICVLLLAVPACSQEDRQNDAKEWSGTERNEAMASAQTRDFAGKTFSEFVKANPSFKILRRARSPAVAAAYSDSDGIDMPGELRRIGTREVLIFRTCRRDKCSSAANLIVIDTATGDLHIVHSDEKTKNLVVVDGPLDIAQFVSERCDGSSCEWEATTGSLKP